MVQVTAVAQVIALAQEFPLVIGIAKKKKKKKKKNLMLEIFHVYLFFGLFGYIYSLKILPKEQGDFAEVSKASHLG